MNKFIIIEKPKTYEKFLELYEQQKGNVYINVNENEKIINITSLKEEGNPPIISFDYKINDNENIDEVIKKIKNDIEKIYIYVEFKTGVEVRVFSSEILVRIKEIFPIKEDQ